MLVNNQTLFPLGNDFHISGVTNDIDTVTTLNGVTDMYKNYD